MRIDKWYLDCQSADEFGYYYVTRLRLGGVALVSTEIHQHAPGGQYTWSRIGWSSPGDSRGIRGAGGSIAVTLDHVDLRIDTSSGVLEGRWSASGRPPRRHRRPLYRDRHGWCDWKLWTPMAEVELASFPGRQVPPSGRGYADFVRVDVPPSRIPFRSLHWGRLFSGDRWIVAESLDTPDGVRGSMIGSDRDWTSAHVTVERDADGTVCAFNWRTRDTKVCAEVLRTLHRGPVLSPERLGRWVPTRALQRITSSGFEEKFFVVASVDGLEYYGPMELVHWHAS